MWKYVAFVLLIVSCVPGEADEDVSSATSSISDGGYNTTVPDSAVTTEAPPTTSTEAAPNTTTTTSVTTEVTTSEVTTVPPPPPTTALPPPDVGKYSVHEKDDDNKTCMRVEMALRVSIHELQASYIYNFPSNASTEGSNCNVSANTQVLMLSDPYLAQNLTLVFVQENKKNYVQDIIFTYSAQEKRTLNVSGHFFSAPEGNSYLCNSDVAVKMENVTLTFSSIHAQAFGANSFGHAEECDADEKVGDIVPIAVGCALGALVIIVLIAYLVGRRRSHQKGYQSV